MCVRIYTWSIATGGLEMIVLRESRDDVTIELGTPEEPTLAPLAGTAIKVSRATTWPAPKLCGGSATDIALAWKVPPEQTHIHD